MPSACSHKLPQNTAPGVVTGYLKVAAAIRDPASLAAVLGPALPQLNLASAAALPCERPAPYQDVRRLKQSQWSTTQLPNNRVRLTIDHEPITNVTGEMIKWAWSNSNMMVKLPGSEQEVSVFMLTHPNDHVLFSTAASPIEASLEAPLKGTQMHVRSLLGTGCKAKMSSGKWGVSCPRRKAAAAFTCDSEDETLRNVPSVDVPYLYFLLLEPTNLTAVGTWDKLKMWTLNHAFTEDKETRQLSCQTPFEFGVDSWVGRALNTITIKKTLAANMDGDIEKTLAFYAVHEVQEFGFYPQWLPAVYKTYAQPQP